MATETLRLLLPGMSEERESTMIQAVASVAGRERPSLGNVIRHLEESSDPALKNLGTALRSISEMRLARLCFAPSSGQQIDTTGWTTVFTLAGLTLPDTIAGREDYSYEQRLSEALFYLVSQFARRLLNGLDRRLPTAIFLDEAWAITTTSQRPSGVRHGSKALDRVTITVYQSAAGEGILSWLTGSVDRLITSLGNAIYFPYLAPVVILGAIWLAWQGLIRKRATRTIEGTIWMVVACAAAIWLIGRPADFTGLGKTVSDGITQTLNVAFAGLPCLGAERLRAGGRERPAGAGRPASATPAAPRSWTRTPTSCGRYWSASRG